MVRTAWSVVFGLTAKNSVELPEIAKRLRKVMGQGIDRVGELAQECKSLGCSSRIGSRGHDRVLQVVAVAEAKEGRGGGRELGNLARTFVWPRTKFPSARLV